MATNYEKKFEKDYQELLEKYDKQSDEFKQFKYEYQLLQHRLETKDKQLEMATNNFEVKAKAKYQPIIDKKDEFKN